MEHAVDNFPFPLNVFSKINIIKLSIELVFSGFSEYFKAATNTLNKKEVVKLSVFPDHETLLLHQRFVLP